MLNLLCSGACSDGSNSGYAQLLHEVECDHHPHIGALLLRVNIILQFNCAGYVWSYSNQRPVQGIVSLKSSPSFTWQHHLSMRARLIHHYRDNRHSMSLISGSLRYGWWPWPLSPLSPFATWSEPSTPL